MPPMAGSSSSVLKGAWRPTKIMNMRDLSRDDDFLSHLLVEKLGTGGFPLVVHKMDPSIRLPKTDPEELMQIVRRLVALKGPSQSSIRQAVDDLLSLTAVRYYIYTYTQKQVNAFATHASRYFELYLPSGSIEIAHTSRYSHHTGKSELCIIATRPLAPGMVISELKGSMADLTEEEDKELKGTDVGQTEGSGIRRDFSVIHSKQLKKNHLFLGPARFVNHDCDHNVELFREGRYITFRVIRHIAVGEEVTAHYGDGYFGRNNRHCLCHTCEINVRGGYAFHNDDEVSDSASSPDGASSDNDEKSDWTTDREDASAQVIINVNERRTRRGVYAVLPDEEDDGSDADIEAGPDATSELTSAPRSSSIPIVAGPSKCTGLLTPETETLLAESCPSSVTSTPRKATPALSFIISTRAQKARAASVVESISVSIGVKGKGKARATGSRSASAMRQLETPPLTSDNGSVADGHSLRSSTRLRARGDAASSASRVSTPMPDHKGTTSASALSSTADIADLKGKGKEDPEMEGRTLRRRPVVPAPVGMLAAATKKPQDGPRGVDGKLLPTCMTCKNVLPVISVEDKVVWNGQPEKTGKRGRPRKQVEQECPRCMRHHAIYACRWPERVPSDGTPAFIPAPRDNRSITPTYLSHKALATLNHKLSSAASDSRSASAVEKRWNKRQRTLEQEERPSSPKKQKVNPSAIRTRGRPPKATVGMSSKARELLGVNGRRSGRARVPSLKMRESEPPSKGRAVSSSEAPVSSASTSSSSSKSLKSDPFLSPPQSEASDCNRHLRSSGDAPPMDPSTPVSIKTEGGPKLPTPKSLAVASQPREANGRFGKKASTNGRYMRKNFPLGRGMARSKKTKPRPKAPAPTEPQQGEENETKRKQDRHADNDDGLLQSQKRPVEEARDDEDGEPGKRRKVLYNGIAVDVEVEVKVEGEETDLSVVSNEEGSASQDEGEPRFFRRPLLKAANSGSGLLSRPNPLTFARRKWLPSVAPEDPQDTIDAERTYVRQSSDDDTDLPETPEDDVDHPAVVVVDEYGVSDPLGHEDDPGDESDESSHRGYLRPKLIVKPTRSGPLTFKPSPFNLARRRWAPTPSVADDLAVIEASSEPSPRKTSRTSVVSFPGLFEAEQDDTSLDTSDPAHRSIDHGVSSEEEGFRGPSILSIYKPGRRSSSSASSALLDLTDDSEQIVERLITVSHNSSTSGFDSRPPSAHSLPLPIPSSPQKSPGMAWKQTVLLPVNVPPYTHSATVTVTTDISPAPTRLMRAGWDSGSSDELD